MIKGGRLVAPTSMRPRAEAIELACIKHRLRMTRPRRVIARVLSEAIDHPDVSELHRRIATVDPGIALATVYRTLKLFQDKG
ncbi:Fur family transcriptional regulator, partial [Stenotrophomonas maltophilia]|uniref:Fur family transcriptional regulator n=1 Tax=Stenotrophomonas maltophilia TaxID=40324 RepID=UPI0031B6999E